MEPVVAGIGVYVYCLLSKRLFKHNFEPVKHCLLVEWPVQLGRVCVL